MSEHHTPNSDDQQLSDENVSSSSTTESTTGLFSYIRLGRPRATDLTSSPTLAVTTGGYVWDFLHWG